MVERDLIRVLDLLVLKKDPRAGQLGRRAGVGTFASAVRHSGGQLVASGRIPIQALLAAIEADENEEAADEGTEQLAATEGEI